MKKESKEDLKPTAQTMEKLKSQRTILRNNIMIITNYVNQLRGCMESRSKIEVLQQSRSRVRRVREGEQKPLVQLYHRYRRA